MNRFMVTAAILSLVLVASMIVTPAYAAPPLIKRPMDLTEATTEGESPYSVDPASAYDTASGELIQNVYDTLIVFNGEHMDQYLSSIAIGWYVYNITGATSPEGIPWYYRYVFVIRPSVYFQPPYNYLLTPADVAYSFQRAMVQDRTCGPQWMLYEPLLNDGGGAAAVAYDFGYNLNPSAPNYEASVNFVGKLIDHAVQFNATHVWFNLAFPGVYPPFLHILCQTCSSILSRQWINNQVIASAGRFDWSGDWSEVAPGMTMDHTEWILHHNPNLSPLDDPTPMMYGSGPFILQTLDYTNEFWLLNRNVAYWRGWPADYPSVAGAKPAGYVDTVHCYWGYDWPTRKAMFLNGDVDFCDVPTPDLPEMYKSPTPPYESPNYPLDGIRCIYPLPQLAVETAFFTFDIDPSTLFGKINDYGVFTEDAIPRDFFGNPNWGIHVRRAFAYGFDYDTYIAIAHLGEASHPATVVILGLPYFDPTILSYVFNAAKAIAELKAVPGLWDSGFTMSITVEEGDKEGLAAANIIKDFIESLNPKFHINVVVQTRSFWERLWGAIKSVGKWLWDNAFTIIKLKEALIKRCFPLVYYPDPHCAVFTCYDSMGAFPQGQSYYNATMDALIDMGIRTPDGPARQAIYREIQQLAMDDCPSFTLAQPVGRLFERDWVAGWFYNPLRQGNYFYNLWKWYYVPESLMDAPAQPQSFNLPADVNYDGVVDMKDVGTAARSFGALAGPPLDPRWVFRVDTNNDRKIDMRDIGYVARQFGKTSATWVPLP